MSYILIGLLALLLQSEYGTFIADLLWVWAIYLLSLVVARALLK